MTHTQSFLKATCGKMQWWWKRAFLYSCCQEAVVVKCVVFIIFVCPIALYATLTFVPLLSQTQHYKIIFILLFNIVQVHRRYHHRDTREQTRPGGWGWLWQRSTHSGKSFNMECLDSWLTQVSNTAVKWPETRQAVGSNGLEKKIKNKNLA